MRRIALLVLCLMVWGSPAWSWDLSVRQQRLLQRADDHLTEAMHDEFWANVPLGTRLSVFVQEVFGHRFSNAVLSKQLLLQEVLRSGAASLRARELVIIPELAGMRARLLAETRDPEARAQREDQFKRQDQEIQDVLAGKKSWLLTDNPVQIENRLASYRLGTEIQRKLLNPLWSNAPHLWDYPELHLAIQSVDPMEVWTGWQCYSERCVWRTLAAVPDRLPGLVARTQPNPDYEQTYAKLDFRVGFWLQGDLMMPQKVLESTREEELFRSYPSVKTLATVEWGGMHYVASRVVLDHQRQAVWFFLSGSDSSPVEAAAELGKLERLITLE